MTNVRKLVLALEDDPTQQFILRTLADKFNYDIEIVSTGDSAIKAFTADPKKFSAILMDMNLPDMSGIECTKRIKEIGCEIEYPIPILAVTAHAFADDRKRCFDAGMDDYLSKPFTMCEFDALLSKWTQ